MLKVYNKSNMMISVGGIGLMPKESYVFKDATPSLLHDTRLLEENDILRVTIIKESVLNVSESQQSKTTKRKTKLVE